MASNSDIPANASSPDEALPPFHHVLRGDPDAPVVTFVPGIGNDATFWAVQAKELSERFRVLTFDPWGHGDSPPPPENCGFDTVVAGLEQLWTSLGIARSALVGLGFGGSVALAAALAYPDRVTRVAAFCCRPRQPDDRRDFWRDRRKQAETIGMDRLADITVDRWLGEDFRKAHPATDLALRKMFKRTSIAGYQAHVSAFIQMDFTDRLPDIAVPVLLVAGEHDHGGGPAADMRAMAEQIAGSTLKIVMKVGHIIPFEASDRVNSLLHDFLCPLTEA